MFRGKQEVKEALTQELRELTLMSKGLEGRLEMLEPHVESGPAWDKIHSARQDAEDASVKLTSLYEAAIDLLNKEVGI